MRHRSNGNRANGIAACGTAASAPAAVEGSGFLDREDQGDGSQSGADRPGELSGNQTPPAGEGSWTFDRSHFRTDVGRQSAVHQEPGCWLLRRLTAEAQRFG